MKKLIKHYLIIIFLLPGQLCIGQTARLSGKLIVNDKDEAKNIAGNTEIKIRVNNQQKISFVDKDLNFIFDSLNTNIVDLIISTPFYYQDTIIKNVVLTENETTHIEVHYPPFCIYDKAKNDKTCPVCNRPDEVIPIVYGLITGGRRNSEGKVEEFKAGGCIVTGCDPNWYCKRDKKGF